MISDSMASMRAASTSRGGSNRPLPYMPPTLTPKEFAAHWPMRAENANLSGELSLRRLRDSKEVNASGRTTEHVNRDCSRGRYCRRVELRHGFDQANTQFVWQFHSIQEFRSCSCAGVSYW